MKKKHQAQKDSDHMSFDNAEKFQFLVKLALNKGASDAKIISTSKVVVEDRVVT